MKALYSQKPDSFEKIGKSELFYRWNIKEVSLYNPLTDRYTMQWECDQFKFIDIPEDDFLTMTLPEIGLKEAKKYMENKIIEYDMSDNVNSFYFNGNPCWLDKNTRVGLMNSTNIEKALGRETTELILGNLDVTLPVDSVIQMLYTIEIYAKDCYNVTAKHKITVENMSIVEQILEYDYKFGYPEKPNL